MFLTDHDVEESADRLDEDPASSMVAVVVGTAVKTVLAAMAGLVLTCGLGLLVWAVTPSSGNGPLPLLRAGIAAFCAASGMTLQIGRSGLTLHPLMLTLVVIALLTTVSGRGRVIAIGREQEGAAVGTAALVYALAVSGIGAGFGGGVVSAAQWWRPAMLALVVVGVTTLIRCAGWRSFLLDRLPIWAPVSVRCGGAATAALLGGGAVTLVIGLVKTFGDSITVQTLAAPGAAGGLGMTLLGILYLPNAVVAATGYSTGVGFTIGTGTYTPFGSSPVELPAVSLLTAAPDGHAFARPTLLLLLFPVLAAVLIGRGVVRRLDTRRDRLSAAGGAALFAAVLSVVMAGAAAGGVTGGEWSNAGVPAVFFGFVVLASLGLISAAAVVLSRVPAVTSVALPDDAAEAGPDEVAGHVDEVEAEVGAEAQAGADEDSGEDSGGGSGTDALEELAEAEIPEVPGSVEVSEVSEVSEATDVVEDRESTGDDSTDPDEPARDKSTDLAESAEGRIEVSDAGVVEVADEPTDGVTDEAGETETSLEATDVAPRYEPDAVASPAIPSPREEDVVAGEAIAGDPDAELASGLSRRAEPGRTG